MSRKVNCPSCGTEIDISDTQTILTQCPKCGVMMKANTRWLPKGSEDVLA